MRIRSILVALVLASPAVASAQGGVARSGMGQGEAAITTRSDVTMGIENGPGTSGARLRALADALTGKMGDVRQCYAEVTADRPQIAGAMRIRVALAARGAPTFQSTEDTTNDASLARCVTRALRAANLTAVDRPASAFVALQFGNSAASGVAEVQRRSAEEQVVSITRNAEGRPEASGGPADNELRYTVSGLESTGDAAVSGVYRTFRTTIPALLDCRRRAGRRGSPEGRISLDVRVTRAGTAALRVLGSTVENERAPICVTNALNRARWEREGAGHVRVAIDFAPSSEVSEAIPEPAPAPRRRP